MKPIQICQNLGQGHIDAYYDELSGKEVRAVLKAGGCSVNVPETAYTQAARRRAWRKRFDAEFNGGNDQLALALLLEWLMRHHRSMLVDYLDFLGVKHRQGETDEDFCATRDEAKLREGVAELLKKYPPAHVATYLLLVGHLYENREAVTVGQAPNEIPLGVESLLHPTLALSLVPVDLAVFLKLIKTAGVANTLGLVTRRRKLAMTAVIRRNVPFDLPLNGLAPKPIAALWEQAAINQSRAWE